MYEILKLVIHAVCAVLCIGWFIETPTWEPIIVFLTLILVFLHV